MNYGYFDDEKKEYVITRPDTPTPWTNYLGSPEYGALISNNAGGYSFAKSGADGRILRYVFNDRDKPGRYIYLRDDNTGDYWSASWQPVGKNLSDYQSECRHGMGYTVMKAAYADIASEVTYYVPLRSEYEVWALKVRNDSPFSRHLTVTGYAEFTNVNNYEMDSVNLQYSQFITRTEFTKNRITQCVHGNLDALPEGKLIDQKKTVERFFGLAGARVDSYCGDREEFIGKYHDYRNPAGVEKGNLGDILSYNENGCGALSCKLTLKPGEEKNLCFVLGMKKRAEAASILREYGDPGKTTKEEVEALTRFWHQRLTPFHVKTPSPEFDTLINTWNAYNCFMTFTWSRAASFIYCGLRNGYGYRDTVQDIQGIIHLAPEMAAERIRFMLSAQAACGGGLPLVKFTHDPGHENTPDDPSYVAQTGHPAYRADDALWLFPTVYKYIAETGNTAFLEEEIPYADHGVDTVYGHLKKALSFSGTHLGPHGMPAGLYADWNDCLRLGARGESVFVAMQYYQAFGIMEEFAACRQDTDLLKELEQEKGKLKEIINRNCWNEDRFIRGFTEDGEAIGCREDEEASLWLNPQSWSVLSGLATKDQAESAMQNVFVKLNTEFGAVLMDPPYHEKAFDGALAVIYNPGTKENAGIFSQSQGWLILAESYLGHGNRAFGYFYENAPTAQNEMAEIRRLEPFCYGQFTEGPASPHFGRSHVHWLTGTASTMMVGCVEGILGIRPDLSGLKLEPAIPREWDEVTITKDFRGKKLKIRILNPEGKESGCSRLRINKEEWKGNYIPYDKMTAETLIELTI